MTWVNLSSLNPSTPPELHWTENITVNDLIKVQSTKLLELTDTQLKTLFRDPTKKIKFIIKPYSNTSCTILFLNGNHASTCTPILLDQKSMNEPLSEIGSDGRRTNFLIDCIRDTDYAALIIYPRIFPLWAQTITVQELIKVQSTKLLELTDTQLKTLFRDPTKKIKFIIDPDSNTIWFLNSDDVLINIDLFEILLNNILPNMKTPLNMKTLLNTKTLPNMKLTQFIITKSENGTVSKTFIDRITNTDYTTELEKIRTSNISDSSVSASPVSHNLPWYSTTSVNDIIKNQSKQLLLLTNDELTTLFVDETKHIKFIVRPQSDTITFLFLRGGTNLSGIQLNTQSMDQKLKPVVDSSGNKSLFGSRTLWDSITKTDYEALKNFSPSAISASSVSHNLPWYSTTSVNDIIKNQSNELLLLTDDQLTTLFVDGTKHIKFIIKPSTSQNDKLIFYGLNNNLELIKIRMSKKLQHTKLSEIKIEKTAEDTDESIKMKQDVITNSIKKTDYEALKNFKVTKGDHVTIPERTPVKNRNGVLPWSSRTHPLEKTLTGKITDIYNDEKSGKPVLVIHRDGNIAETNGKHILLEDALNALNGITTQLGGRRRIKRTIKRRTHKKHTSHHNRQYKKRTTRQKRK